MRRLLVLTLIPSLAFGPVAYSDEFGLHQLFLQDSSVVENCPQVVPAQVHCEAPVVVAPRLRTVCRTVPRTTYQTVTKTIMVPTTVLETRQTQSVEYRDEVRERSVTVYDQVPETRRVTTEQTVLVPETRYRTEEYTVQVPVVRSVPQQVTTQSVQMETRTGTRQITRDVCRTELQTVRTGGQVVKTGAVSDYGGVKAKGTVVGGCEKQVAVPVKVRQTIEQTYQYTVPVARPVTTTRLVQQTEYQTETRTRSVPETVHVRKVQATAHDVTEMKSVPRQKTETYTERVPHVVTNQVQVPVTKMVPKTVTEQIPVTTYDVIEEMICE